MCMISNYDLFEEFFEFIKDDEITLSDTLKEYGGSSLYIPSYKTTGRNEAIMEEYLQMNKNGTKQIASKLARKYDLTTRQIYSIIKTQREGGEE